MRSLQPSKCLATRISLFISKQSFGTAFPTLNLLLVSSWSYIVIKLILTYKISGGLWPPLIIISNNSQLVNNTLLCPRVERDKRHIFTSWECHITVFLVCQCKWFVRFDKFALVLTTTSYVIQWYKHSIFNS